jgi:hypothetical protein
VSVEYLWLPDTDDKVGLDDYVMAGHTVDDLWALVNPAPPPARSKTTPPEPEMPPHNPQPVQPVSLTKARKVFKRWLGDDYDTDALDAMLAAAAVEKFDDGSDLVWLLLISGPGNAKTETVQALAGAGAIITSAISSEAALLSGTAQKERAKTATGGLLRKIGERGVLVIKDVTSVLSMDRNIRGRVLAALREVYDGSWYRELGTDGGKTLEWRGRITVVGAVTTAWDAAHTVISACGDRFVLIRVDSTKHRVAVGCRAIANTGDEFRMRVELAEAAGGVIAGAAGPVPMTDRETEILVKAADLVTLARTGVEYDYKRNVIDAHMPEAPTRFAKQLTQIVCGGVAIGMDRADALRLAIRCARDSMPPLRLTIVDDVAKHPHSTPSDVRKRIDKPRSTVDTELQALHYLGVVTVSEEEYTQDKFRWYYSLANGIDPAALDPAALPKSSPEKLVTTPNPREGGQRNEDDRHDGPEPLSHVSGEDSASEAAGRNGHPLCTSCHKVPLKEPESQARGRCRECHLIHLNVVDGYDR